MKSKIITKSNFFLILFSIFFLVSISILIPSVLAQGEEYSEGWWIQYVYLVIGVGVGVGILYLVYRFGRSRGRRR